MKIEILKMKDEAREYFRVLVNDEWIGECYTIEGVAFLVKDALTEEFGGSRNFLSVSDTK